MPIREITDTAAIDSLVAIVATYDGNSEKLAEVKKQLLKELSLAGIGRRFYIFEKDDTIAAMIQLVLDHAENDPELADGREIAHVHNLQVRKELQRRGIGRGLMEFVEKAARGMGKKVLTLGVDDGNERAIKLYKKLGYETFKIEPGRTADEKCFVMRKTL